MQDENKIMEMLKDKKVLVLGGSYFVGFHIVQKLIKDGCHVTTLNRGTKKRVYNGNINEIFCDRKDQQQMKDALINLDFDYVIDVSGLDLDDSEKIYNSFNIKNIKNIKKYIYISSSAVYSPTTDLPIKEDDTKGENDIWQDYGINKLDAELFFLYKYNKYEFPIVIIRPPYIYGEGNYIYREGFIFDCIMQRKPVILPDSGDTIVQFIYIDDLYQSIKAVLVSHNTVGKAYNVGNACGTTFLEWINNCMEACNQKVDIINYNYKSSRYECRDFFPFFDYQYVLDTKKINAYFKPQTSMVDGLKKSYVWYLKNNDMVKKKSHYMENMQNILYELNKQ